MKTIRRMLIISLALALCLSLTTALAADKPLIGIIQYVPHPALDAAREGFLDGLKDLGLEDGAQITVDSRNANASPDILASIADHFLSVKPDLVLAIATPAAQTMAGKSEDIPILGTAITDYVDAKLAKSNEEPGYNVSGTTDMNPVKEQIDLLRRLVPDVKKVGLIYTSSEDNSVVQARMAIEAIEAAGLEWTEITVNNSNDVQQAALNLVEICDVIYVPTDNIISSTMATLHEAAMQKKLPIIAGEEFQVLAGATATRGISYYDLGYQTASMAKAVLDGADIATMPIQGQNEFTYLINKTVAEQLGMDIPEDLLPFAVEVP